jgi:hypothetical protein
MKRFSLFCCLTLAISLIGCAAPKNRESSYFIEDPLMNAIQLRFGRPDRVTGTGRAFLHYDLGNGDTVIIAVSGDKIIGVHHEQKD